MANGLIDCLVCFGEPHIDRESSKVLWVVY